MKTRFEPRFDECKQCRFFQPRTITRRCLGCTSGQYFEEKVEEMDLEKAFSNFGSRADDE